MARIIGLMSGKGGVGKTTTAINLGYAIHKLGAEVIVVEGSLTNPNLSHYLGNTYFPVTLHEVMQKHNNIHDAVYEHECGLKIIPANTSIDALKLIDYDEFRKNLQDLHLVADFIIIDGSSGLGRQSEAIIDMSEEVLVLTNPLRPTLHDSKRVLQFIKKRKKPVSGVVVNKHTKDFVLEDIEDFLDHIVLHTISTDSRFDDSIHKKAPFTHIYPNRRASVEYDELAKKITGKMYGV